MTNTHTHIGRVAIDWTHQGHHNGTVRYPKKHALNHEAGYRYVALCGKKVTRGTTGGDCDDLVESVKGTNLRVNCKRCLAKMAKAQQEGQQVTP